MIVKRAKSVKLYKGIKQLVFALALGAAYLVLRLVSPFPEVLFPDTARMETVELLGGLLLFPALLLSSRFLAMRSELAPIGRIKAFVCRLNEKVFLGAAMLIVFTASLIASLLVLDGIPHVQDSIVTMYQAKIFASGRIGVPEPAHPEFFRYAFIKEENGLLHSKYLPTQSLLLVPGILIGAPFLIEPLLAAITLLLIYLVSREMIGRNGARGVVLLLLTSPFFIYMHASYFAHSSCLLFFTLCVLSLVRFVKTGRAAYALLCTLSWGLMFNARPQTAYVLGMALLPFALANLGEIKRKGRALILSAFGLLPGVVVTLAYRYPFTGKPVSYTHLTLPTN